MLALNVTDDFNQRWRSLTSAPPILFAITTSIVHRIEEGHLLRVISLSSVPDSGLCMEFVMTR